MTGSSPPIRCCRRLAAFRRRYWVCAPKSTMRWCTTSRFAMPGEACVSRMGAEVHSNRGGEGQSECLLCEGFRMPAASDEARSGESPAPQPWSIIAEPVKVGDEWYVLARHPSSQLVHVRRFKTQSEAKFWIARKSKAWLKKQGYVGD